MEIRVADYREVPTARTTRSPASACTSTSATRCSTSTPGWSGACCARGACSSTTGSRACTRAGPGRDAFTYRYIFPDGDLHPVSDLTSSLQRIGLEVRDVESLRDHYPLTLRRWLANLRANRDRTVGLVGAERERIWELYLLASAIGFEDADVTVYQVLATRPDGQHKLPLTRAQLLKPTPEDVARRGQPGAARFPGLSSIAHTTST